MKKVLTIAGSDSCGGAGIQADLKTFSAIGVYGMSVITAVTAQNTQAVYDVLELSKEMIKRQIEVVFDDIEVDAVKIGMVSNAEIINTIYECLSKYNAKNIVIDPVMVSKSGYYLLRPEAIEALKMIFNIANLVTPNIPEAELLTGIKIENLKDMKVAAEIVRGFGVKNVLIKGGHGYDNADDVLLADNKFIVFEGKRIETQNTHGTGCTLSSAIASCLAKGHSIEQAVEQSKAYISTAIENSFSIGKGVGPVGHFIDLYKKAGVDFE